MKINFLEAAATKRALKRFMEDFDEFLWAVAWGTHADHGEALLKHRLKIRCVTFGIAFNHTDPELVKSLIGVKNAFVAPRYPGGTYHPKVYAFRSGDEAAAIVGSANFTNGGLIKNLEATVSIVGKADEPVFKQIFSFIERASRYGQPVDRKFADAYRLSCRSANRLKKPARDPVAPGRATGPKASAEPFLDMPWSEYRRKVRSRSGYHDVDRSLGLLKVARTWFVRFESFRGMSPEQRKAIGGVLGESDKTDPELQQEWGWFGSMSGMGDFKKRIANNDRYLARALDGIPNQGEVTRDQYGQFVEDFRRAFRDDSHRGGVATASRLLAMKRPDTFLCVCGPNIAETADAMGFAWSTLDLDNYWDRVVSVVRLCDWYNSPRPIDGDGALWDSRAAMLDAIFYRP